MFVRRAETAAALSKDERKRGIGILVAPEKRWLMYRAYAEGKGTEKDMDKALDWVSQAYAWSYSGADHGMVELKKKLQADKAAKAAPKAE